MSDNADTIRALLPSRHYDGVWCSAEESEKAHAALDALLAENQRLRDALKEACDWLDADLADNPDSSTALADRELVAGWRAALL